MNSREDASQPARRNRRPAASSALPAGSPALPSGTSRARVVQPSPRCYKAGDSPEAGIATQPDGRSSPRTRDDDRA